MSYDLHGRPTLEGFNPLAIAAAIQKGAEKLATNIERIGGKVSSAQQKVNTAVNTVTRGAQTGAEVVRATSRAGIATAATGDASSGLAAASMTSPNFIKLAGILGGVLILTHVTKGRGGSSRSW